MHYFVSGHTGFKGSWLVLALRYLGHTVSGFSDVVPKGGLFEVAGLAELMENHWLGDVRDSEKFESALATANPEVAIHLAAQSLVLNSYADPASTIDINVSGTLNFLEAVKLARPLASLVVTSDKVYRDAADAPLSEEAPLGGRDPYSASKAAADILTQSVIARETESVVLIARAGNVIGAFDHNQHRLLPDINRAIESGSTLELRNPNMVRPWQHVLDCLAGYLAFIDSAISVAGELPRVMNFGPSSPERVTARGLTEMAASHRAFQYVSVVESMGAARETNILRLDSSLSRKALDLRGETSLEESVAMSLNPEQKSRWGDVAWEQVVAKFGGAG